MKEHVDRSNTVNFFVLYKLKTHFVIPSISYVYHGPQDISFLSGIEYGVST